MGPHLVKAPHYGNSRDPTFNSIVLFFFNEEPSPRAGLPLHKVENVLKLQKKYNYYVEVLSIDAFVSTVECSDDCELAIAQLKGKCVQFMAREEVCMLSMRGLLNSISLQYC